MTHPFRMVPAAAGISLCLCLLSACEPDPPPPRPSQEVKALQAMSPELEQATAGRFFLATFSLSKEGRFQKSSVWSQVGEDLLPAGTWIVGLHCRRAQESSSGELASPPTDIEQFWPDLTSTAIPELAEVFSTGAQGRACRRVFGFSPQMLYRIAVSQRTTLLQSVLKEVEKAFERGFGWSALWAPSAVGQNYFTLHASAQLLSAAVSGGVGGVAAVVSSLLVQQPALLAVGLASFLGANIGRTKAIEGVVTLGHGLKKASGQRPFHALEARIREHMNNVLIGQPKLNEEWYALHTKKAAKTTSEQSQKTKKKGRQHELPQLTSEHLEFMARFFRALVASFNADSRPIAPPAQVARMLKTAAAYQAFHIDDVVQIDQWDKLRKESASGICETADRDQLNGPDYSLTYTRKRVRITQQRGKTLSLPVNKVTESKLGAGQITRIQFDRTKVLYVNESADSAMLHHVGHSSFLLLACPSAGRTPTFLQSLRENLGHLLKRDGEGGPARL